jgi:hypothetical protein
LILLLACACSSTPAPAPQSAESLAVNVLYPNASTVFEMGQSVRFIFEVVQADSKPRLQADTTVTVLDPSGTRVAVVPAEAGAGDVYRSQPWPVPHRSKAGVWSAEVEATDAAGRGRATVLFDVRESPGEALLSEYGFWIDPPAFRGITPSLWVEKGNAADGMIRWGGTLPAQHVIPEEWLEIHWRSGEFDLEDGAAARRFMLEEVGEFGFTRIRELGPFEPFLYQGVPAWKADARGAFRQIDIEWVVAFAPDTARTWAIGTTVVLPPAGLDAHAALRESVEFAAGATPTGVAPEPLPRLEPAPRLLGPPMDARFEGPDAVIDLEWGFVRELEEDEYYQVEVDFNYQEANPRLRWATRASPFRLPSDLYRQPNCRVFNWQVTVMRQTSTTPDGQPIGVPVSYRSFYWYLWWSYPPGEPAPFPPLCPNAQV